VDARDRLALIVAEVAVPQHLHDSHSDVAEHYAIVEEALHWAQA
jgi:hypothetical protein